MNRETLEMHIAAGRSQREIAEAEGVSQGTVRYWLDGYGLKTSRGPFGKVAHPHCVICGETDLTKFYGHKRNVCAACHNADTGERGRRTMERVRELLGGSCIACGYNRFHVSLDVHHRDPSRKAPNFRTIRGWSWDRIVEELEGCCLLCKNCHAAHHAGLLEITDSQ